MDNVIWFPVLSTDSVTFSIKGEGVKSADLIVNYTILDTVTPTDGCLGFFGGLPLHMGLIGGCTVHVRLSTDGETCSTFPCLMWNSLLQSPKWTDTEYTETNGSHVVTYSHGAVTYHNLAAVSLHHTITS